MGVFSFVKDDLWRETLEYDYACLTPEDWTLLRSHNPDDSFMWHTNGSAWDKIRSKMYDGHSGASMACSLRTMEQIAKIGWKRFVQKHSQTET
jgi:hypothetical protein